MSRVVVLPRGEEVSIATLLDELEQAPRSQPFGPTEVAALGALSKKILAAPELRRRAEAVALGYWLRPANLQALRDRFWTAAAQDPVRVAAGLVFHVPPANVDTVFVFSWALSLLCGNRNLVRMSQRRTPLVVQLLLLIEETLGEHGALAAGTRFVTYGHQAELTALISSRVDVRVAWGGDASVTALRAVPLSPRARDIAFADRLSLAVLRADAWLAASERERAQLAGRAFSDIYSFDQLACSSPRVLVWVGSDDAVTGASGSFSTALRAEIIRRGYSCAPATALAKYAAACRAAIDGTVAAVRFQDLAWVVVDLGDALPSPLPQLDTGGGMAVQVRVPTLSALAPRLDRRVQTIGHFGFSAAELLAFVQEAQGRGCDRLVPIGSALEFSPLWDGYNLFEALTRVVEVRA